MAAAQRRLPLPEAGWGNRAVRMENASHLIGGWRLVYVCLFVARGEREAGGQLRPGGCMLLGETLAL